MKLSVFSFILILGCLLNACTEKSNNYPADVDTHWTTQTFSSSLANRQTAKTYLPVYSHIYSNTQHKTHNLTVMASVRNINEEDSIFLLKATYYNGEGELLKQFLEQPIYLKPLQTIEIIIPEEDESGGAGANFIFEWAKKEKDNPPLIEGIMNSTMGQQGLSFTTQGIHLK